MKSLLNQRINTIVGSLFIGSYALAMGLMIWHASFDTNPLATAFASVIGAETIPPGDL